MTYVVDGYITYNTSGEMTQLFYNSFLIGVCYMALWHNPVAYSISWKYEKPS